MLLGWGNSWQLRCDILLARGALTGGLVNAIANQEDSLSSNSQNAKEITSPALERRRVCLNAVYKPW